MFWYSLGIHYRCTVKLRCLKGKNNMANYTIIMLYVHPPEWLRMSSVCYSKLLVTTPSQPPPPPPLNERKSHISRNKPPCTCGSRRKRWSMRSHGGPYSPPILQATTGTDTLSTPPLGKPAAERREPSVNTMSWKPVIRRQAGRRALWSQPRRDNSSLVVMDTKD